MSEIYLGVDVATTMPSLANWFGGIVGRHSAPGFGSFILCGAPANVHPIGQSIYKPLVGSTGGIVAAAVQTLRVHEPAPPSSFIGVVPEEFGVETSLGWEVYPTAIVETPFISAASFLR
jgi:hypothetical protein